MGKFPKISIIVPVYNSEQYLRRCIDSIHAQTFEDFELLLIDDGSTDNSGIICDEYASTNPGFRVFHNENQGVSATREFGISQATGEFIIHMDADDWAEEDMLESLYNHAITTESDMVICDFFEEWSWGKVLQKQKPVSLHHESVLHDMYGPLHGSCWNKLVRRSLFEEFDIHFPNGINFCEDLCVNTALLKHNIKVSYLPKAFYHYDHTANPSSIVNDKKRLSQRAITRVEGLKPLLEKDYPDILEKTKYYAKLNQLRGGEPYRTFLNCYSEINGSLQRLEKLHAKDRLVSFAIRNRVNYYTAYLWIRFKDFCFTLRHI